MAHLSPVDCDPDGLAGGHTPPRGTDVRGRCGQSLAHCLGALIRPAAAHLYTIKAACSKLIQPRLAPHSPILEHGCSPWGSQRGFPLHRALLASLLPETQFLPHPSAALLSRPSGSSGRCSCLCPKCSCPGVWSTDGLAEGDGTYFFCTCWLQGPSGVLTLNFLPSHRKSAPKVCSKEQLPPQASWTATGSSTGGRATDTSFPQRELQVYLSPAVGQRAGSREQPAGPGAFCCHFPLLLGMLPRRSLAVGRQVALELQASCGSQGATSYPNLHSALLPHT